MISICLSGCLKGRCYQNADCPSGLRCDTTNGACVYQCSVNTDCLPGHECIDHVCIPSAPDGDVDPDTAVLDCPDGMVPVNNLFCIDRYEASRPDARPTDPGATAGPARSVPGVLPWQIENNAAAEAACGLAGKRLCSTAEWELACTGPDGTVYAYGDVYSIDTCNGLDTFGVPGYHLTPTGAFPSCTNEWGVFDINGNLWEHVRGGSGSTVRGGAYNCINSARLHQCGYIPGSWTPTALGFRCCLSEILAEGDGNEEVERERDEEGGEEGDTLIDGDAEEIAEAEVEGEGCLPDGDPDRDQDQDEDVDQDRMEYPDQSDEPDRDEEGSETIDAEDEGEIDLDSVESETDAMEPDGPDGTEEEASDGDPEPDLPTELEIDPDPEPEPEADPDTGPCPSDMAVVGTVCIDRYEASRPDATATSAGLDSSRATSRSGVLPWYVGQMDPSVLITYSAACQSAGKRLCTPDEWFEACNGPDDTRYFFGADWDPEVCNCVDTFCDDYCLEHGISPCNTAENCGYQYYSFHVTPTGAFPGCTNGYGLFDVNGNIWEIVPSALDARGYEVRGGAFNCAAPSDRLRCVYNAGWNQLFAGFRCCRDLS